MVVGEGMCDGGGHAWQGVCGREGMHGNWTYLVGGGGHAWQWGISGRGGHTWQEGGMRVGIGRYASYWNAFLL